MNFLRLFVGFSIVVVIFCGPVEFAEAKSVACSKRSFNQTALIKKRSSLPNLASFGVGLFRGGRPDGLAGFNRLRSLGVKTVIDLQGGDGLDQNLGWLARLMQKGENQSWIDFESSQLAQLGMVFKHAPLNSFRSISEKAGRSIGTLLRFLADPANQPIYIHCEYGKDRTGLMVALYRVIYQNWPRQKAYSEMVSMGHDPIRQFVTGDLSEFFWAATAGYR